MPINPLSSTPMHQHNLRLLTNQQMHTYRKHKAPIVRTLAGQESKLLVPQPLNHRRVHIAVRAGLRQRGQLSRCQLTGTPIGMGGVMSVIQCAAGFAVLLFVFRWGAER
jgi:hypothetical protein